MSNYRIIQDNNGDLIAQRQVFRDQWIFFMDFEECESIDEAEAALKKAIQSQHKTIIGYYDDNGNRLDEYPKDIRRY